MQAEFRQLKQKQEYMDAWPLVHMQNPDLSESEYWRLLAEMLFAGHLMAGLYLQERLIGVVGVCKASNWLYGEHLWLHLMLLDKDYQAQGHEAAMLDFVIEWAEAQSCTRIYTTLDIERFIRASSSRLQQQSKGFVAANRLWQLDLPVNKSKLNWTDCIE